MNFPKPYAKLYVDYLLRGDFDPTLITSLTNVEPFETVRKGDRVRARPSINRWQQSFWKVRSLRTLDPLWLQPHVESVLSQLKPGWSALIELGKEYDASFECTIHLEEYFSPLVDLSVFLLSELVTLNAELGFDWYWDGLSQEERTETPRMQA